MKKKSKFIQTIDERLGERLLRATRRSTEFTRESRKFQEVLEKSDHDMDDIVSGFDKLVKLLNEVHREMSAAIYGMKETGEVGEEIFEKLAQDATLVSNLTVFMKSDPAFVSKVLQESLPETLKAAFLLLDSVDRQKLREVLDA